VHLHTHTIKQTWVLYSRLTLGVQVQICMDICHSVLGEINKNIGMWQSKTWQG